MGSRTRRQGASVPGEGDTQEPEEPGETLAPYLRDPEDPDWLAFPSATTDQDEAPRRARSLPPLPFAASNGLSTGMSGLLDRVMSNGPFLWSERNHNESALHRQVRLLPAIGLALVVVLAAGTFAWVLASKAASRASIQTPAAQAQATVGGPGGLVLQAPNAPAATPQAPGYLIGAWLSQTSPSGGATQVFVRVSHDSAPVAGVPVSITISIGGGSTNYGPTRTDAYGVAAFNVVLGVPAGTPGYLAANATAGGQALSFGQAFVTSVYAPVPPPEPTAPPPNNGPPSND